MLSPGEVAQWKDGGLWGQAGRILLQTLSLTRWLKQGSWEPHVRGPFLPLHSYLATEVIGGLVEQSLKRAEIVVFQEV